MTHPCAAASEPAHVGELIDLLDGATTLVQRSSTLDGSVPLRAARACTPLLAGNRLGWQLALTAGVTARRRLGRWHLDLRGDAESLRRRHTAALPIAVRRGLIAEGSAWHRRLAAGPAWVEAGDLWVWTGLLVRASADAWLRVAPPANRRPLGHTCATVWISPSSTPVPLVLRFTPSHPHDLEIHGEVATLAAFAADHPLGERPLVDAPDLAAAHLDFFDADYFDGKRTRSTMKYKTWTRTRTATPTATSTLAAAGPSACEVVRLGDRVDTPSGPDQPAPTSARITAVQVRNAIDFAIDFDGVHVTPRFAAADLADRAAAVTSAWQGLGPHVRERLTSHGGALWYFTKYFTPHVVGEPHFFVKPCALLKTPPGHVSVLEGVCTPAWDVMRGVVATDILHAMPAVFRIHAAGTFTVPRGAVLMHAIPTPADLLAPTLARSALTW